MHTLMRVLPRIICEEFQHPAEFHHFVRVRDAARSDGEIDMILSFGCSYKATVPLGGDFVERLMRELKGEDPQWVLWSMRWGWTTKSTCRLFFTRPLEWVTTNAKTTKKTACHGAAPSVVVTPA